MRIVVDTNVITSAIFFGGKPYQLLRYIMEGQVGGVASKEIVDEYEEIILRLKQMSQWGVFPNKPYICTELCRSVSFDCTKGTKLREFSLGI